MRRILLIAILACLFNSSIVFGNVFDSFKKKSEVAETPSKEPTTKLVPYSPKDFSRLLGMPGFSDQLLKMHFKLYEGYVKNTNLLLELIQNLYNEKKDRGPEYAGLKRVFGWEFDGMRLHEYYFGNLGRKSDLANDSFLFQRIKDDFGSYEKWKEDFIATGLIRGIGWAILYIEPLQGRLINVWINEHDLGHLSGAKPLLVMDVFEHAYITEYALDRAKYIDAFFQNIDWQIVSQRYQQALNQ